MDDKLMRVMSRHSISEILFQCSRFELDEDQVEFLKMNDSPQLRLILKLWYHPEIKFNIPDTPPPYKPLRHENHMILFGKAKMLLLFAVGGTGDGLSAYKREAKFIELLQQVHGDDAEMLIQMISKKPLDYLSFEVVKSAFPEIF